MEKPVLATQHFWMGTPQFEGFALAPDGSVTVNDMRSSGGDAIFHFNTEREAYVWYINKLLKAVWGLTIDKPKTKLD